jgi:hypothetical protein
MSSRRCAVAFEFDPDAMFKACAFYLSKGLILVRVHGIYPDGRCTCGNPEHAIGKAGERSVGKHPVGTDWGNRCATTEDQILEWLEDGIPFNVGCLMGPRGGVIDSEDDSIEARNYRKSIGMDGLETPTWVSGKSTHQLTRWDDRLADCKGTDEPGGLEVRIGAGAAAIQSVLPPSWHRSGVQYEWKPGFTLEDVDIAPTPKELLVALCNNVGRGAGRKQEGPVSAILFGEIPDGKRHRAILRWTWCKIVNQRNPLDRMQQEILTREVMLLAEHNCRPAADPDHVRNIISDCYEHYRRKSEAGWKPTDDDCTEKATEAEITTIERAADEEAKPKGPRAGSAFELYGLKPVSSKNDAYEPGDWSIEMIHSDPPEIVLVVPAWKYTACKGRIHMTLDTFRSAPKVASAVFNATRTYILDGDGGRWHRIWKGHDGTKENGYVSTPGLMELLMQKKREEDDIEVGTSSLRYAQLAAYVLQSFKKATKPRDEEKPEPNESGRPCWVTPDELWFQWGKIWEEIGTAHDVAPGERNRVRAKLLDAMAARDFPHKRHRFPIGRLEYVVFTREWVAALESLASGAENELPVKGDGDRGVAETKNHSPSTVHEMEVVGA